MKQVLIRGGQAHAVDVPAPTVGPGNVLVKVLHSCISAGTELSSVHLSGMPLYRRARQQPQNVKRVLAMVREQGLASTVQRVRGKLAAGSPTGYSASGCVVAIGPDVAGFSVGDVVACAGAGIANHAEYIDVPVNLAVRVPDGLSTAFACTVTLGAIAMQGVRRTAPTLGESVLVVGLGILGQLTAQLLAASGCRVIGVDLDPGRIDLACSLGMEVGIDANIDNYVERVLMQTGGFGADAVIVTAASTSNDIINEAMRAARKKGRVVLVGDVGLALNRADIYPKELDFLVSTSYGPGRYDPVYEEGGLDYPLPYVRWTENRNMQSYLELLANGRVQVERLISGTYDIDKADQAYASLQKDSPKPMMVLLSYPRTSSPLKAPRVNLRDDHSRAKKSRIRVGLVGASSFAQGMHLPNLRRLGNQFSLHAVVSRTGTSAKAVGDEFGALYCTTDLEILLADPDVDLVMITTRHDRHGAEVLKALAAGKHVFVEKPLTLDPDDLGRITDFYSACARPPILMVGYNRRFAPGVRHLMPLLKARTTPLMVNYRMNAGFIANDHWVQGNEGGGRNLGEACHIYDLFSALVGDHSVTAIQASAMRPSNPRWRRDDNFAAVISFQDGSVCTLSYTSMGDKAHPKEQMEIFFDGRVLVLDDYRSAHCVGGRHKVWTSSTPQKGQYEELLALGESIRAGDEWPISLESLLQTSRIAFDVERQLHTPCAPSFDLAQET